MRIAELQLIRYGRFEDCTLPFPTGACDLHMIVGRNEAGKSTTLAAVADLLFGIEFRTRFAFRFDRQLLRIGAKLDTDGGPIEVRRRKANSDTLLGPDERPIGEAHLAAFLAGQTRETFERMFGLNHLRLRAGGAEILKAHDEVGRALFAAGTGLTEISRICDALEAEAKEIWTNRADSTRRYHQAAAAYEEARHRLRDLAVRASRWAEAKRALDEREAELETLKGDRAERLQARGDVERKRRTLTSIARRRQVEQELNAIKAPVELGEGDEQKIEAALEARSRATTRIERERAEIARLEAELAAEQPDPTALELQAESRTLTQMKAAVEEAEASRPRLQAERDLVGGAVADLAKEIGWAKVDATTLQARLPGRPALAEIRALITRRSGITTQLGSAREVLEQADADLKRAQDAFDTCEPAQDLSRLRERLRGIQTRALGDATARARHDLAQLETLLRAQLEGLAPWRGEAEALKDMRLPNDADLTASLRRIEAARQDLDAQSKALTDERERMERLQLDRQQSTLQHPAPSVETLAAAREARAAAWAPIQVHLSSGVPLEEPVVAAETFESRVSSADQLADERYAAAEHAGGLATLDAEIEKSVLRHAQTQSRLEAAQGQLAAAEAEFRRQVAALPADLTPASIELWLEAVTETRQTLSARDDAALALAGAQDGEARARAELATLLAGATAEASLADLMGEAEARVLAEGETRTRRAGLEAQVSGARAARERASDKLRQAEAEDADWASAWVPALASAGLPEDAGVAGAEARLQLIDDLRTELARVMELDKALADADARIETFALRLGAASERLGLKEASDQLFSKLTERVVAAVEVARRLETLSFALGTARTSLTEAEQERIDAEASLQPLTQAAPDGDIAALRAVLKAGLDARRLRGELRTLERGIVQEGEGRALEALVAEVDGADPETLVRQVQDLSDQLLDLNGRVEAAISRREQAQAAVQAISDGPEAAAAAADMAQARSEMAEQAELYIRKRAEIRLLRAAIDRYREEKQAPLLNRASQIFQTLTLGGFEKLMVDFEGDTPKLFGQRSDGETLTSVEGMSEGTLDQLYLAIRIAAVEEAVAQGIRLPFLADDLFVNFDDERAAAGFKVLAELATKTQVLFFTHHTHLAKVASEAVAPIEVCVCGLDVDEPLRLSARVAPAITA